MAAFNRLLLGRLLLLSYPATEGRGIGNTCSMPTSNIVVANERMVFHTHFQATNLQSITNINAFEAVGFRKISLLDAAKVG